MASLAGKIIAVTGGASGIGLATAKILAQRGALLAIADVNKEALDRAAESIKAEAGNDNVVSQVVDIRKRTAVKDWLESIKQQYGRLSGCANVAGVSGTSQNLHHIWEVPEEDFIFVNDVNSRGLFNCLAEQLRPGVLEDYGSIAVVSSVCGLRGLPRSSPYVASKHAAVGLTKCAAMEAGARKIRVNSVAPGIVETPMLRGSLTDKDSKAPEPNTPIARNAQPEEIGSLIAFLLSDESKFITGATYGIDGGWNI